MNGRYGSKWSTTGRIRAFLPELDEIVGHGLAVLEPVTVVHFAGAQPGPRLRPAGPAVTQAEQGEAWTSSF